MHASLLKLVLGIFVVAVCQGCSLLSWDGEYYGLLPWDSGPNIRISIDEVPEKVVEAFHGKNRPREYRDVRKIGEMPEYYYEFILPDGESEKYFDSGAKIDFRTHGGII